MIRSRRHQARRGYAMGLFLVVLTVLTTTIVTLLTTAASESRNSYRQVQLTKAKVLGVSALDSFYDRLQRTEGFPSAGRNADDVCRSSSRASCNAQLWYSLSNGAITACRDAVEPCYQLRTGFDPLGAASSARIVAVTAVVRHGCLDDVSTCRYAYFNQNLRSWQFTDFLFYTQFNVIAPSVLNHPSNSALVNGTFAPFGPAIRGVTPHPCAYNAAERSARGLSDSQCPIIAYTSNDTVRGPVYSADDFVMACVSTRPTTQIFEAGTAMVWSYNTMGTTAVWSPAMAGITNAAGCDSTDPSFGKRAPIKLTMPRAATTFRSVWSDPSTVQIDAAGGTAELTFNAANQSIDVKIGGTTKPSVSLAGGRRYVVAVNGDAVFTGGELPATDVKISVFVEKQARITDDLTYSAGTVVNPPRGTRPTGAVLGINAGGDIIVENRNPSCADTLSVDAILVSLGGTVFAGDLNSGCAQTLSLRGAVATKYQGVYGLFDATTGRTGSGYVKDFTHDSRSLNDSGYLPPSLVTPAGLQWVRLDLAEVYCQRDVGRGTAGC